LGEAPLKKPYDALDIQVALAIEFASALPQDRLNKIEPLK
ncbi:26071_t:CDS:1, partial [Dentiscutata erythropus]